MTDLFSSEKEIFDNKPYSVNSFNLPDADVSLYNGLFNETESDYYYNSFLDNINWKQDKIKFFGKMHELPRLTAWYGDADKPYTYSGIPMNPLPWNTDLLKIKEKIEMIAKVNFTSVLLNLYRNGSDSVAWHSDDEKELGQYPIIGSVTFGESRTFQLRHKQMNGVKENIVLTHGSFLLMKGLTQHNWQHQIPKSSRTLRPRINLTFRIIS